METCRYDFANILFAGPCNLRCPHCIGRQLDPALSPSNLGEFPPRNLDTFVETLLRCQVHEVVLTGTTTDPQLYRHEARLIAHLRAALPGVRLSLHTNGQLALAKMEVWNLYDRVTISFPSFDSAVYERMTGSHRVPDLAAIVARSRIPVKVSCLVDEPNAGSLAELLAGCQAIGIRRLVLRRLYGDRRHWTLPPVLVPTGAYRGNAVYDFHGMEVTWWEFESTTSTSLNLFSSGLISSEYLLARAAPTRSCKSS